MKQRGEQREQQRSPRPWRPAESAGWRERVTETKLIERRETSRYLIPAYGFLERLEISPQSLLPNFDASLQYTCEVHLYSPNDRELPVLIEAVYRNAE